MTSGNKYIPLIYEQQLIYRDSRALPGNFFNLSMKAVLAPGNDEEKFLRALELTVERLPYCNFRLHTMPDGTTVQYRSGEKLDTAGVIADMSKASDEKVEKTLKKWAQTPFVNGLTDVPLYNFKLVRTRSDRIFFVCIHHIIADIYALMQLVSYVDRVYEALCDGTELPDEAPAPDEMISKVNAYYTSEKFERDLLWWKQRFTPEPVFTSINGSHGREFIKGKRYGRAMNPLQMHSKMMNCEMSEKLYAGIKEKAAEMKMSETVFFALALRTYLGKVSGTEDVSYVSQITARATLLEKSCGLERGKGVFMRTNISGQCSFAEALRQLNTEQRESYKHSYVLSEFMPAAQYGRTRAHTYYTVMLSYVPFVDYSAYRCFVSAEPIDSGVPLAPVYMMIMPNEKSGKLIFGYKYSVGYIKPKSIAACHDFMLKFLENGIADENRTIRELSE